jgi:1A family penicillin-binding protein
MGIIGLGLVGLSLLVILVSTLKLPDFKLFNERKIQSSTKIYDRTGEIILYDVHQDIKRTIVSYEDMGVNIKNATVAIEDSEFYKHNGIRIKAIIRAVWSNFKGQSTQGGSTITQQVIKETLLTSKKTITRKIKEWILAVKLEREMSKEEILALYLNEAPYGGNIYGIEEASKAFFGKKPIFLSLAESAYLAAIPNGPTYYSPYGKNKDKLEIRKNLVLKRMKDLSFITEEDYNKALEETVVFLPAQPMHIAAPHFVFFIKDYLEKRYGAEALDSGGLKVITTLDYNLQKKAEEITLEQSKINEKSWGGKNAAVVVIDPKTGQILAMVGSKDYFDKEIDGNYNVTTALRQPGSSFKPIVYATAFQKGYTADTVIFDVPTEFSTACDSYSNPKGSHKKTDCYNPDNYDNSFRGPMTFKNALAQSINVIAVKVLYLVGINDSIKMARDLGITSLTDPNRYGLSLVIGGGETSLLEMTSAYGVFANEGVRHPYQSILSIEDANGNEIETYQEQSYQVLETNITRILSDILSDNTARTPTFGANSALVIPGVQVAVKTGTTNDNKDAWTIGYTPSVAVGVWVGNNDNIPMKKGGAALAGPIWNQVMVEALKTLPKDEYFNKPDPIDPNIPAILRGFWQGGETFVIDKISGALATEFTPIEMREEKSITDVHTILYWIDRDDPLNTTLKKTTSDNLYSHFETGVQNWWAKNGYKYKIITEGDKPKNYDSIHSEALKPVVEILGLSNSVYPTEGVIDFSLSVKSLNQIKKIDIFVNNNYITSLKTAPYNISFPIESIQNISSQNIVKVIAYDVLGNIGQQTSFFRVEE